MTLKTHPRIPAGPRRAFTLIEILTAVAITTIIVFALVSMFNTSTKALHAANRLTDVWEAARATFGVLRQDVGEVTTGGGTNRVNLFSANALVSNNSGYDMRLQDIYLLSRDNNQWHVNIYLLGKDRPSDDVNDGVKTLYRFQTNYPVYYDAAAGVSPLELPMPDPRHPYSLALAALDKYLDDRANGIEPDNRVNVMAKGIVHLRLVSYANDGRAFTNLVALDPQPTGPLDYTITPNLMEFRGEMLPASVDLEMFVLDPDRIEEFRAQFGDIARQNYLDSHANSVQLFRTRIPIQKDILARQ